jgi:hypothetical protein
VLAFIRKDSTGFQALCVIFVVYPLETTVHLLTDCPGTYPTRASLGISFDTLVNESSDNIIHIARFNTWLRGILPIEQFMATHGTLAILNETLLKRKVRIDTLNALCPVRKCTKQQCYLVIPQPAISDINTEQ